MVVRTEFLKYCVSVSFLTCGSCLPGNFRTNGVIQCNVLKVSQVGKTQQYKNERVQFILKNDSLMIKSMHIHLSLLRMRQVKAAPVIRNSFNKQFLFKDGHNELYDVLYIQNQANAKLYLYVINVDHLKPAYMFTNDSEFNMSSKISTGEIIVR
jgi:hypothetical protein